MIDLNEVVLTGRMAHDPELEYTKRGTPVLEFRIANSGNSKGRGGRDKTEFICMKAWSDAAEQIADSCDRGMFLAFTGRITVDRWRNDFDEVSERVYVVVKTWRVLETEAQTQRRRKKRLAAEPDCPPVAMPRVREVRVKIGQEYGSDPRGEKPPPDAEADDIEEIVGAGDDEEDEFPGWDDVD